jgi:hypothetical protein
MAEEAAAPEQQQAPRRGRGQRTDFRAPVVQPAEAEAQPEPEAVEAAPAEAPEWNDESPFPPPPAEEKRRSPRGGRKAAGKKAEPAFDVEPVAVDAVTPEPASVEPEQEQADAEPARKAARKPAARCRRPAKPKAVPEAG